MVAPREFDKGFDKDGNVINNNGGDTTDYKYDSNGNVISSTSVTIHETQGGEVNTSLVGYGYRSYSYGTGGALDDPSWDIFTTFVGIGEIKAGFMMVKNGVTLLSKAKLGFKVLGVASKGTLKSSVKAMNIYGLKKINLLNGTIKRLPYLSPYGGGTTARWSSFYGRNAAIFGAGRVGIGSGLIYNTRK